MMRSDTDPDVFLTKWFQVRDELGHLGEVVSQAFDNYHPRCFACREMFDNKSTLYKRLQTWIQVLGI